MKVGIITVFRSRNCGSFWQAYATQEACRLYYDDAFFLAYRATIFLSPVLDYAKYGIHSLLKLKFGEATRTFTSNSYFHHSIRRLFSIKPLSSAENILIGSDTLWNVKDKYFKKYISYYCGCDIPNGVLFSTFATSVGNSSDRELKEHLPSFLNLNNAVSLSSRDLATQDFLYEVTGRRSSLVVDPTMLFDKDFYLHAASLLPGNPPPSKGDFILIYAFRPLSDAEKKSLCLFAKERSLRIVSLGGSAKWCDANPIICPSAFISLFATANFVVTDTFHGVVFSLNFGKKFMVLANKKNKVAQLLTTFGVQDVLDDGTGAAIAYSFATKKWDFEILRRIMLKGREESLQYLNSAFSYKL